MSVSRGPKRRLSEDEFADAALAVVNRDGLEALNIRGLATALEMSPGSLYTYFENKQALLDRMLGRALAGLPLDEIDESNPRDALRCAFRALFDALSRNPAAVELLIGGVSAPQLDRTRELMHRILEGAGFGPAERTFTIRLMMAHVIGSVVVGRFRGTDRRAELARRRALPKGEYPLLRESSKVAHQRAPAEAFDTGLDALLDRVLGDGLLLN